MTEPTDSEILDAADDFRSQYMHGGITFDEFDSIGFARAVLAKWGTPLAVAGEPVGEVESSLRFTGGFHVRLYRDAHMPEPGTKLYTTTQPTQAQAGAVPLTDEQRARIVLLANTVGEAIDMVERAHGIKGGQHAE